MKDPNTGKFTKGNPGRPKGAKNVRTLQWEELGELITGHHADRFTTLLDELWQSKDTAERMKAADLFLRTLDYFKPKLQRIQGQGDNGHGIIPPLLAHDGIVQVPPNWPGPIVNICREMIKGEEAPPRKPNEHVIKWTE
jgi:hypothetical protein